MPSVEGDGSQRTDMIVGAAVTHYADSLDRQQHGEGLPDRVVEPRFADLVEIDRVGFAQHLELLRGDRAGNADREARPGKRVTADKAFGQAEFAAEAREPRP